MIPSRFEYMSPTSLPEAVAILAKYPDDAKVLAGGQSLISLLKLATSTKLSQSPAAKRG